MRDLLPTFSELLFTVLCLNLVGGRRNKVMLGGEDHAWLKICKNNEILEVQADTCSKGIWLNSSMPLGCVCVNGVWILSNDYCDENAIILVGKGHCFDISLNVRSIKLLGRDDNPFYPSIYTSPTSLDTFSEISENLTPVIDMDATMVIGINPMHNVRRIDELVCLRAIRVAGKPVYIYKNGRRLVNQWKIHPKDCNFPIDFDYKIGFGEMFRNNKILSGDGIRGNCAIDKCTTLNVQSETLGRSLAGSSYIPKLTVDGKLHVGRSTFANQVEITVPFQVTPGSKNDEKLMCLQNRADITQDPTQYEKETKEQTARMIRAHLSLPLLNVTVIKPNLKELDYLQWMSRLMLDTCEGVNDIYIPMVIHSFTRMFYRLLHETQEKFPHVETTDEAQHKRIIAVLDDCSTDSEEMHPLIATNATTGCKGPTGFMNARPPEGVNRDVDATKMPNYIKGNITIHDLAIETIWKIFLGGYYRCSDYFQRRNAIEDFNYMTEKITSLFNLHIIKRWYASGDATKIYKFIFRIDLQDWINQFDLCVATVKEMSALSKTSWLLRPKLLMSENDLSQKRIKRTVSDDLHTIWSGKGYCLNDFLDPINKLNHTPAGCLLHKNN